MNLSQRNISGQQPIKHMLLESESMHDNEPFQQDQVFGYFEPSKS